MSEWKHFESRPLSPDKHIDAMGAHIWQYQLDTEHINIVNRLDQRSATDSMNYFGNQTALYLNFDQHCRWFSKRKLNSLLIGSDQNLTTYVGIIRSNDHFVFVDSRYKEFEDLTTQIELDRWSGFQSIVIPLTKAFTQPMKLEKMTLRLRTSTFGIKLSNCITNAPYDALDDYLCRTF